MRGASGASDGSRRPRRIGRALLALTMVLGITAVVAQEPASAALRDFELRYSGDLRGDLVFAANTLMTCSTPAPECATAQAGGNGRNNDFTMVFTDVDGDASTANSSSANLAIPAGSTVEWAGLYWGGRNEATPADTVKIDLPAAGLAYQTVLASEADSDTPERAWFADVTELVQAGGAGTYTVGGADITQDIAGNYAGWSLQVAYSNPTARLRSLRVFDGLKSSQANLETFNLTGLYTPPVGDFDIKVGAVAYDGDRPNLGDFLLVNEVSLGDALTPANNFYNSTISRNGVDAGAADRNPAYGNNLGFDAKQILVDGDAVVGNGATSMKIDTRGVGEVVIPQVITTSIDLYAPAITVTKSAENLTRPNSQPTHHGDVIEYTINVANAASTPGNPVDTATDVRLHDDPFGELLIVRDSLQIVSGPNSPANPTADEGDDLGSLTNYFTEVNFNLGNGATATEGGSLPPGTSTTVKFRITIESFPSTAGFSPRNQADVSFGGEVSGVDFEAESNLVVSSPIIEATTVCSGMSLKVLTITPTGSNLPSAPCVNDSDLFPTVNVNLPLLLSLKATGLNSVSGNLPQAEEAPGGQFGYSDIAQLALTIPGVSLKVTGLHSEAVAFDANSCTPALSGSSKIATLVINGVTYPVGTAPLSIPLLGLGGVYVNQTVVTGSIITQRAIFIDLPGTALDVVIGEAKAGIVC